MRIYWLGFLLLSACSVAHYTRHPDGTVDAYGYSLGTNTALEGFAYQTDGKMVQLQMQGYDSNQTRGLEAIVSGAVQGAIKGIKPK